MKQIKVKDLMIPKTHYAMVYEDASLYDAVVALEEARRRAGGQDQYRAILVLNRQDEIIGKLNLWDVLRGIEPGYKKLIYPREPSRFGFGSELIKSMLETYGLWGKPLEDICQKAPELSVKEVMHIPGRVEYIDADTSLNEAIHQLIAGHYQSLLVTQGGKVVGVLRLGDVFREISEKVRGCRKEEPQDKRRRKSA